MRSSIALSTFALISTALGITITTPNSGTKWDFSTAKTIKFTSSAGDPTDISIILIDPSTNFQIKIADNVKTSSGEYTTQPNPSVPAGSGYEIQVIDNSGVLAKSDDFTVQAGANDNGNAASSAASTAAASTAAATTAAASSSATAAASSGSSGSSSSSSASASASLVTVTATSSSATTSATSSTSTGAAAPLSINQMTIGAGALFGLAFLFA